MANEYAVNSQDLKAVADAIRTKGGASGNLVFPGGFATAIGDIKTGENVEQATPTIDVSSGGLITASATQKAGLVAAGTKSATKQLTVQAAQTITPGTSNKTIASGRYLTGTQTIEGDSNLTAANIKKGVSIFGVSGGYAGVELNFTVVGGTSQPSNPAANTIWVNTSTAISGWTFSPGAPTGTTSGHVWITTQGVLSTGNFNALKNNSIVISPMSAKQYVSDAWKDVSVKIYQDGTWKTFITYVINNGEISDTYGFDSQMRINYDGAICNVSMTKNSGYVYLISDGAWMGGRVTSSKVNVGNLNTIEVDIDIKTNSTTHTSYPKAQGISLVLASTIGTTSDTSVLSAIVAQTRTTKTGRQTLTLDVKSTTGSYYVGVFFPSGYGVRCAANIYSLKMV